MLGICLLVGVFFILPFMHWLSAGRWEWLSHRALVLAAKLLLVGAPIMGTAQWLDTKLANKKGSEK